MLPYSHRLDIYFIDIFDKSEESVRKKKKALSFNESKMSKIVGSRVSSNFQESSFFGHFKEISLVLSCGFRQMAC